MIELTRCGAPDNDRYLPAVMTQGDASTYQTMIDNSTMQKRSQQMVDRAFGSAQGGTTQNGQQQGGIGLHQIVVVVMGRADIAVGQGQHHIGQQLVRLGEQRVQSPAQPLFLCGHLYLNSFSQVRRGTQPGPCRPDALFSVARQHFPRQRPVGLRARGAGVV